MGHYDGEVQVVGEVMEEDFPGTSVTLQQYNRNIFRTEIAFPAMLIFIRLIILFVLSIKVMLQRFWGD